MTPERKAEIVRRLLAAFLAGDREAAETLLDESFTFTSPYDDGIDRARYFERCWPNGRLFRHQEIERICTCVEGAYVTYRAERSDGTSFRNTEFFTFAGDRIASVDVYFGAAYKDGVFIEQK